MPPNLEQPTTDNSEQIQQSVSAPHPYLMPIVVLVIILGLVLGYYLMKNKGSGSFSSENVKVLDAGKQLPIGFPTDIPVEVKNISKAEVQTYTDRGATLYAVQYTTIKQSEELFFEFGKYLSNAKYTVTNQSKSSSLLRYQATRGKEELTVMITTESGLSKVQLVYVVRK